jgi:hypothetical protein
VHRCSYICVNSIRSRNARTTHPLHSTVRLWLPSDGKRRRAAPSPSPSRSRSRSRSVYHPSFASLFRTGAERACARAVLIGVCVRARVGNSPVLFWDRSFVRLEREERIEERREASGVFFCFRSRRVPEQPSVGERFRRTIDRASERFEIGIAIGSAD